MSSATDVPQISLLLKELENKYLRGENLMMKSDGARPLVDFLPEVNADFKQIMKLCESLSDEDVMPGTATSKGNCLEAKHEFDERVKQWLEVNGGENKSTSKLKSARSHRSGGTRSTSSTVLSEQRRSRYKVKMAELALKHEKEKVHETRQRTRERAEAEAEAARLKAEAEAEAARLKAEAARLKAEAEAEAARLKAGAEAEAARLNTERALREAEVEAEIALQEKRRELEAAQVEAEVWEEESVSSQSWKTSLPAITFDSRQYDASPENKSPEISRAPDSRGIPSPSQSVSSYHVPLAHPLNFESTPAMSKPIEAVPSSVDFPSTTRQCIPNMSPARENRPMYCNEEEWRSPNSAQAFRANQDPYLNRRSTGVFPGTPRNEYADMGERLLPRPMIDKFNGDPMNYWTFIRQFEAHITRKVHGDDVKLLFLLQHCEEKVRAKINHLTSKPPNVGFRMAWSILYEEYGQPHEIARCCEERLKYTPKISDQDPDGIKQLAILMDKCCTSMQDVERSSTLDSMEVMLSIIGKLPVALKLEWVKRSVQIEIKSSDRAKFADLTHFVTEQSRFANSIFGRAAFPSSRKIQSRRERCMAANVSSKELQPSKEKSVTCICCSGSHALDSCDNFKARSCQARQDFVRSNRLCFKCLKGNHVSRDCRNRKGCTVSGCSSSHHTLLHRPDKPKEKPPDDKRETASSNAVHATECSASVLASSVYLNVVPVKIRSAEKEVETYAFLDQGSTTSFCEQSLAKLLDAAGEPKHLTIHTLTTPKVLETISLSLQVKPLDGGDWINLPQVVAIDEIPVRPNVLPSSRTMKKHGHLRNLKFPKIENGTVQLLIGANVPEVFRVEAVRKGSGQCPDAVRTPLGWSLLGPLFGADVQNASSHFVSAAVNCPESLDAVHAMFLNDESDLKPVTADCDDEDSLDIGKSFSAEDRRTYKLMKDSVEFTDGRYQLPLPWRHDYQLLPDNRMMATKRLNSLKKRLCRDSEMKRRYAEQMQTMLDKGYAEVVPDDEIETNNRTWYLPHHPVVNPHKPDKVRIVFDCAAQHRGISINQVLMQGPDLVNSLVGVLTRFRRHAIAIIADVEAMFHQVKVAARDCDSLRFWWWPQGDLSVQPAPHRMRVHLFGATSSPSCASFCLRQAAIDFGGEYDPFVATTIERNFYVDDCLVSVPNPEVGKQLVHGLRSLLSKAGFRLTKWLSNCQDIIHSLPEEEHSKLLKIPTLDGNLHERVLGINWNVHTDEFKFTVSLPMKPRTRRGMLSTMNSLFDPLGFVTPVVLEARLIYRSLCQQELEWDEPIRNKDLKRWENWLSSLPSLQKVSIPRSMNLQSSDDVQRCQLHYFCDASKIAYGAVCYLRSVDVQNHVHCTLVMGKSHLAPRDEVSIPRLELMAAVIAVKMDQLLSRELGLQLRPSMFWSDSSVVLQSLHNDRRRFPRFVCRRLAMISKHTCTANWRHVPTKSNPADLASRGATAVSLVKSGLWFSGPRFLGDEPELWPSRFEKREMTLDDIQVFEKIPAAVFSIQDVVPATDRLVSHFSSLYRLKRSTAWLLKYKQYLVSRRQNGVTLSRSVSVTDLKTAEAELIKYEQRQHFAQWFSSVLGDNRSNKKQMKSSPIFKLDPIVVDGLLRVGGRLEKAPVGYDARHPVIMPHVSHLTALMIRHYHERSGHSGLNHTMNLLSQHVWIVKGTAAVRREISGCLLCRRRDAKSGQQLMAELPPARLQMDVHPFAYTGTDYFGPLLVRQRRSDVKRYGCLFTCLTTRAVHLEVATDLTTDTFINALRRFISRRGPVLHIYSDNGTNFVGAERVLRESIQQWNQCQIQEFLKQNEIEWSFNPPSASHMGGVWERMIRSVRRILTSLSGERTLTDDQLHTFLLEAESILNSRPLTPVTLDIDGETPLTPNHLLMVKPASGLPPTLTAKTDCYAKRRWRHVQYLADQFWLRWSREYLRTIIARQKWHEKKDNLKIDDVVLLVDGTTPRSQWSSGRVSAVHPDEHGIVRTVSVMARGHAMKRPIHKLCLLVPAGSTDLNPNDDSTTDKTKEDSEEQ